MASEIVLEDKTQAAALQRFVRAVRQREEEGCYVSALGVLVYQREDAAPDEGAIIQTWANMDRMELVDFLQQLLAELRADIQQPEEA